MARPGVHGPVAAAVTRAPLTPARIGSIRVRVGSHPLCGHSCATGKAGSGGDRVVDDGAPIDAKGTQPPNPTQSTPAQSSATEALHAAPLRARAQMYEEERAKHSQLQQKLAKSEESLKNGVLH